MVDIRELQEEYGLRYIRNLGVISSSDTVAGGQNKFSMYNVSLKQVETSTLTTVIEQWVIRGIWARWAGRWRVVKILCRRESFVRVWPFERNQDGRMWGMHVKVNGIFGLGGSYRGHMVYTYVNSLHRGKKYRIIRYQDVSRQRWR